MPQDDGLQLDLMMFVENLGNLACPALFDLGEPAKVVVLPVTEGEDKLIQRPHMFPACKAVLPNKTGLLPHIRFNAACCAAHAREADPETEVLQVSARPGEGMAAWRDWPRHERARRPSLASA